MDQKDGVACCRIPLHVPASFADACQWLMRATVKQACGAAMSEKSSELPGIWTKNCTNFRFCLRGESEHLAIFCPVSTQTLPDAYAPWCVYLRLVMLWADFIHSLEGIQWLSFDAAVMAAFYPRNGATNVYVRSHYRLFFNTRGKYFFDVDWL
jgi:hypothetical protein